MKISSNSNGTKTTKTSSAASSRNGCGSMKTNGDGKIFDVKKEFKSLLSPKEGKPEIIEVPGFKYLSINGKGDPNTAEEFGKKIEALYRLAYSIKVMMQKDENNPFEFKVPPLSGLWDADDITAFTEENRKDEWKWTLMMLMPDLVTDEIVEKGKAELIRKKHSEFQDEIVFRVYEEGACAQIMHVGPYDTVGPTVETLHKFLEEKGYVCRLSHHEIYLSDRWRCAPEKMKTIIRQPICKK